MFFILPFLETNDFLKFNNFLDEKATKATNSETDEEDPLSKSDEDIINKVKKRAAQKATKATNSETDEEDPLSKSDEDIINKVKKRAAQKATKATNSETDEEDPMSESDDGFKVKVVKVKKRAARKDLKLHYCFYCGQGNTKIWRHWQRCKVHIKPEWNEINKLANKTLERKKLIIKLKHEGDRLHNGKVTEDGEGGIVTNRRPEKGSKVAHKEFITCPSCLACIKRTNLAKHKRSCKLARKSKMRRNAVQEAECFEKMADGKITPELSSVLCRLRQDPISNMIMNDPTLIQWGQDMIQVRFSQIRIKVQLKTMKFSE